MVGVLDINKLAKRISGLVARNYQDQQEMEIKCLEHWELKLKDINPNRNVTIKSFYNVCLEEYRNNKKINTNEVSVEEVLEYNLPKEDIFNCINVKIDLENFIKSLSDKEVTILDYSIQGYTWDEIVEEGFSREQISNIKKSIINKWKEFYE